ncbi:uncharacterized protein BXIN_1287 [Babesia sp. Xinjiang]|uniref:uncharacterized protein n=1 Tax=Babesia sp. Xinjiang TaxID=462227 RepID=UPI000A22AE9E|nr:uncharacterized protein BXIN_1287 [Babesia sp. Xinjiang]ORM39922.1 hypothetical protein BXIN_1287 [Babesia sp. Xinjiang]
MQLCFIRRAMLLIAFVCAQVALGAVLPRWKPMSVDEYFQKMELGTVDHKANAKQLGKMYTIDRNTLAHLLHIEASLKCKEDQIPIFPEGWKGPDKTTALQQRFGFYGMMFGTYEVRGDGKCLFRTISEAFRLGGMTVEKAKKLVPPNTEKQLAEMVKAYQPEGEYYSYTDLMKFSLASILGVDSDSQESINNFDPEKFKANMDVIKEFIEVYQAAGDNENLLDLFQDVNFTEKRAELNDTNALEIAVEIHKKLKKRQQDVMGSNLDINSLQNLFHYAGMAHFKVAGLVDGCNLKRTDKAVPRPIIMAQDVPLPLAILAADN